VSDDVPLSPLSPPQRVGPPPPPSYRPARPQQRGLDPATRGMAIGAGCIVVLLLLLVAGWAITGRHGGTVPLITADRTPWRVAPANPGGLQVAGAYGAEDLAGQRSATAPTPESPSPEALRAAQPEPPPPPVQPQAEADAGPAAVPDAPASPDAVTPPVAMPPVAAPPVVAPPVAAPSVAAPSGAAPPPVAARPVPAAPAPVVKPAPPSALPQLAAPARPVPNLSSGGTFVQLAALDSEAGARAEWQRIKGRMADVIADRQPVLQRAERNGHAIWRLRVGGFSSIADATRFCEHVRAKGGACELATF
jgi:hypothetical protein